MAIIHTVMLTLFILSPFITPIDDCKNCKDDDDDENSNDNTYDCANRNLIICNTKHSILNCTFTMKTFGRIGQRCKF